MGCDGGTIPTRDELVRLKKKPEKKDKNADLAAKWKHCAISQEPLQPPIVACELGRLYKKDKVIELLLDKTKFECAASFEHIRGLKDVKELGLTDNTAYKGGAEKGDGYVDHGTSRYICPVTGLEMSGRYRFVILWGCGCVVSERALKEIKSENCHKCQKPFRTEDVVVLNGTEEDVTLMQKNMEERRLKAKLEKKSKKKHKAEAAVGSAEERASKFSKLEASTSRASSTSQTDKSHSSQLTNGHIPKDKKLVNGKVGLGAKLSNGHIEKKETSIQSDPSASSAYKSLFTTSAKAKNQPKGHWVTHNPLYY